ncbi:M90 family metallopeptidase [Altererythrobacter lutimaris]|uniref:Zinc-dependent peptidase n=1 Tax=Altererythrobacter lutimaris TaxID=2743979 RepID=A0A850HIN3_9SPHN|nr:M90 family metallopeptidase [Altererythrobacter lutimaris]NVE95552.1 zinc-dependent peptidase [Altererythrobacter lutimaris]
MSLLPVLLVFLLIAGFFLYRWWARKQKRARLLATPLTQDQRKTVTQLVPIVRRLPRELHASFEGKINLFLDQMTFRGHNGIEVSEEMKLSIAAQACLLIVNSPAWYHTLRNVLIYPSAFRTGRSSLDGNIVHERDFHMLGESWDRGPIVLSWDHALQGGLDAHDGYNVVIHEFAHQLDSLTGHTNGIPILRKGQAYEGWEKAMLDAYHDHVARVEHGQHTLIDPYGATNHQEFFAEAVVTFFEKAQALRREEPALYAQLSELLALDPATWT